MYMQETSNMKHVLSWQHVTSTKLIHYSHTMDITHTKRICVFHWQKGSNRYKAGEHANQQTMLV